MFPDLRSSLLLQAFLFPPKRVFLMFYTRNELGEFFPAAAVAFVLCGETSATGTFLHVMRPS